MMTFHSIEYVLFVEGRKSFSLQHALEQKKKQLRAKIHEWIWFIVQILKKKDFGIKFNFKNIHKSVVYWSNSSLLIKFSSNTSLLMGFRYFFRNYTSRNSKIVSISQRISTKWTQSSETCLQRIKWLKNLWSNRSNMWSLLNIESILNSA